MSRTVQAADGDPAFIRAGTTGRGQRARAASCASAVKKIVHVNPVSSHRECLEIHNMVLRRSVPYSRYVLASVFLAVFDSNAGNLFASDIAGLVALLLPWTRRRWV